MIRYPERLLTDDERILDEFNPHWRVLLLPALWTTIAVSLLFVVWIQLDLSSAWLWTLTALIATAWMVMALGDIVSWYFTNFILTNERLILRQGVFKRTGSEIPIESIDNVTFERTIFERILGFGDLTIESAQGSTRFDNIPRPEDFQSELYSARENRTMHLESGGTTSVDGIPPIDPADDEDEQVSLGGSPSRRDRVEQLEHLADLHDQGVLDDEEFLEAKRRLLRNL